ncbi:hypothetical protein CDAR_376411 [Caerostris darwini]|uniref:Uncharacterized protein n=1 Tax=Caerostris darwini TaxID=1538125 RepID=A0AAV4T878_9ARAC|nr:hypothetical protein CDAR_376411 [Caerostris darwini]
MKVRQDSSDPIHDGCLFGHQNRTKDLETRYLIRSRVALGYRSPDPFPLKMKRDLFSNKIALSLSFSNFSLSSASKKVVDLSRSFIFSASFKGINWLRF